MRLYFLRFEAFLLIVGILWCAVVFKRLRSDLREFREAEPERRVAVRAGLVTCWLLTLAILVWMVVYAWGRLSGRIG